MMFIRTTFPNRFPSIGDGRRTRFKGLSSSRSMSAMASSVAGVESCPVEIPKRNQLSCLDLKKKGKPEKEKATFVTLHRAAVVPSIETSSGMRAQSMGVSVWSLRHLSVWYLSLKKWLLDQVDHAIRGRAREREVMGISRRRAARQRVEMPTLSHSLSAGDFDTWE